MFRLSFVFILSCCVLSLGAAKRLEKIPDWVLAPSTAYSEKEYIVELGTGSSQKEADSKAVEGLAAIFNRSVSSKTDSSLKYNENTEGVEKVKSLDQTVSVVTNVRDLIGVEIKERWKSKSGIFYALAVLNRNKAVSVYSEKAMRHAFSISEVLDVPSNEKGTFQEYFRYVTAYAKSLEMSLYHAYLAVLNPASSMVYEKNYTPENLKIQASIVAKNIFVKVNLEGCDERLKAIFENIFTFRGFTIAKTNSARYMLNATLKQGKETELSDGRIMVRYTLTCELLDSATSNTLLPFVINDRAVQFNSEAVNNQIFKSIKKRLERDFNSLFDKFIEGASSGNNLLNRN